MNEEKNIPTLEQLSEAEQTVAVLTRLLAWSQAWLADIKERRAQGCLHEDALNHRSGSALNVQELRERFLIWLFKQGKVGEWLPDNSRTQMCKATQAWECFGKVIVDPLIDQMVADGEIEIRSYCGSKQVRLKPGFEVPTELRCKPARW